jgi:F-type H+-transporting ATPase subunit delta
MKATRAAGRYGTALIDLAIEQNTLEVVKSDAELVLNAIKNSRDLRNLLSSPVMKPLVKDALLKQIFAGKISDMSEKFISLIVRHGREKAMAQIFESYLTAYRNHKNILRAHFTASAQVSDKTLKNVKEKLEKATGKTVELEVAVKPELIGGFVVEMENYRLDASLATSIKKLKRELSK